MNTRPGFSSPNAEAEPKVEVSAVGTLVVENGEPYPAEEASDRYAACLCSDGRHGAWDRTISMRTRPEAERFAATRDEGHVVTLHTVTVVIGGAA